MIKTKISAVKNIDGSHPGLRIIHGEKLSHAILRSLEKIPLGDKQPQEIFAVFLNGHHCPSELWDKTTLVEKDTVLIIPKLQGDEGLQRALFVAVSVAFASTVLGPALGIVQGTFASGIFNLGVTLALTSLIAPPQTSAPETDFASSQMYSISGQSNATKRLDIVPKVYGTHRVFPNVAANPYVEFQANPVSGKLDQYLCVVYDLGLGPMEVEQIKIGDTVIGDYSDVEYRLVDLNRPLTDEGTWDRPLQKTLSLYKGDVSIENLSVTLDRNQEDSPPPPLSTYEVIRTAAANTDGSGQTISVTLAFPQGLVGFFSNAQTSQRSVEFEISFQKVGETEWRAFNDYTYVNDFTSVGGDYGYQKNPRIAFPIETNSQINQYGVYSQLRETLLEYVRIRGYSGWDDAVQEKVDRKYGYAQNATLIVVKKPGVGEEPFQVDDVLYFNGEVIGKVQSVTTYLGDGSGQYDLITLQQPLQKEIILYSVEVLIGAGYRIIDGNQNKFSSQRVILGRSVVTGQTTETVYATFSFTPKASGQFRVRLRRLRSFSSGTSAVRDTCVLTQLSTRFDRAPILTTKRHVFLEMRIRATNQLNGSINNLSAVCTSVLDTWNGSSWVKQITRNPAWVFVDLLTGEVNKRAIPKSRLDIPSISAWADHCDEIPSAPMGYTNQFKRFETNFVLDYQTTLQSVLNQVTSAANASLNIIDGKYGVLQDILKTVPVQIFTPRNSSGFSSQRQYPQKPDGLKIKFVDPSRDWEVSEVTVYDSGFDETTAINLEEMQSFACTNAEQAWRFGRYVLFSNRLRQETITIQTDFEHLVCTRGDYVQITQDAMKAGGSPARVVEILPLNNVRIDDGIETGPLSYGYVFRKSNGVIHSGTCNVVSSDIFELSGPQLPDVGDLIVIGEVGKVVYDCIVKSITPNDDLSATLVLIEKADDIYTYEYADTFPEYRPLLSLTSDPNFAPPGPVEELVIADTFYECDNQNGYITYIDIAWNPPSGSAYEAFEVFVNSGEGFNSVGLTRNLVYRYQVARDKVGVSHDFKVLALSPNGNKRSLGDVPSISATPLPKSTPPSDVEVFSSDITAEVLQLTWQRILDCDCKEYLIRYSPLTSAAWENTIPLVRVDKNTNSVSFQARTGTYLIKAVDFNGNESVNAKAVITTIPELFNLNIIDEINDFPTLLGTYDQTVKQGSTVLLQQSITGLPDEIEYYPKGHYYYSSLLDLDDIYTVRIQSLIQAEGFTADDLMVNWTTLDTVLSLVNTGADDWDVISEYRATDSLIVIEDWVTLSSIDTIGVGNESEYTEWRPFTITDATGRVFQFRLELVSNKPSVTPRVFEGTIKADMADRLESYTNLNAPNTGLVVNFNPPFKGPAPAPSIQITIENGQSGDYWEYVSKTLQSFEIIFYDKTDTAVARQFDAHVKGYGRSATATI